MANYIPEWKIVEIVDLAAKGLSIRKISERLGIAKETTRKWVNLFGPEKCPCGKLRNHKGWCSVRVALSSGRQEYLFATRRIRPVTLRFWKEYPKTIG